MFFKTLKHKSLEDTFGYAQYIDRDDLAEPIEEVYHSNIPHLHPETATHEGLVEYWRKYSPKIADIIQQEYDLVLIELTVKI